MKNGLFLAEKDRAPPFIPQGRFSTPDFGD